MTPRRRTFNMGSASRSPMVSLASFRGHLARSGVAQCLAVSFVLVLSCAGAKRSRVVPPQPDPPVSPRTDRVTVRIDDLEVRLEVLDGPGRLKFLNEKRVNVGADPFADDPKRSYRFVTFKLDLINATEEDVNLHPTNLRAITDAMPHFAMEYTGFYEHFISRLHLDPSVLEDLEGAVIMSNIEVPAGSRASGLIVFKGFPDQFKRFRISCMSIMVGTESRTFTAFFDVIQEKIPKKRKS